MEIVGRTGELADIRQAVHAVASGESMFRAYEGEPGMGKTSILLELMRIAQEAGIGPAVVIVDDLHDVGALTMPSAGMLLAVAYRPRQLPPELAAILTRAPARLGIRRLAPLGLDDTRLLLGGHPDAEAIHRDSGGVPLYARALAGDRLAQQQAEAELLALPPVQLEAVQAAAVLGDPFAPQTLAAMADHDSAAEALDTLVARDVLRIAAPGPLLAFRHPALAAAAYRTIAPSRRSALHLRADNELERIGAPAIARAGHVANSPALAVPGRYLTLAAGARQAIAEDPVAATGWLEAAGARLSPGNPHWTETQLLLAKARFHLGDLNASRAAFLELDSVLDTARIERFLGRYPEATALTRQALRRANSAAERAAALIELSAVTVARSEYASSDRLATEAAQAARQAGDPVLETIALSGAAWARIALGDISRGTDAAAAAANLADSMVDTIALQDIDCLRLLGQSELLLDRLTEARRHLGRGVRLCRQSGQRHLLPNLLKSLAELELRVGRLDCAARALDEAEPLAAEAGQVAIQTISASVRASVLVWQLPAAEAAESVAAAERAVSYCTGMQASLVWPLHAQAALGEALTFAQQPGHALRVLLDAGDGPKLHRIAPHRRVRWWEIMAIAAVVQGDLAQAEEYASLAVRSISHALTDIRCGIAFRMQSFVDGAKGQSVQAIQAGEMAMASFTAAGALLDLGRAQVITAAAGIDAGRLEGAADRLAMAASLARRCRSQRLAEQAAAQLARLPQQGREWQTALTPRECDVAELAAQGLASTAIASQLRLSVRTVDSHLGRVYRKLGVSNRVALANRLNGAVRWEAPG